MKNLLQNIIAGIVAGVIIGIPLVGALNYINPKPVGSPHVLIETGYASGSATYIGDGDFVTAAHVVSGIFGIVPVDKVFISFKDGLNLEGKVTYYDPYRDIAVVHVEKSINVTPAKVNCSVPNIGDKLISYGNPWDEKFLYSRFEIVGDASSVHGWKEVIPVLGTNVWGMSGGGVFNENGELMGVDVGVMIVENSKIFQAVGFAYIVPAYSFCEVIGYEG